MISIASAPTEFSPIFITVLQKTTIVEYFIELNLVYAATEHLIYGFKSDPELSKQGLKVPTVSVLLQIARSSVDGKPIRIICVADQEVIRSIVNGA